MLTLMLTFSLAASPSLNCDLQDLGCWKRTALMQAAEIDSLGKQIEISLARVKTTEELVEVYKKTTQDFKDAADEALKSIRPDAWYRSPVLWFSIGAVVVGSLVVALVYALVPAVR